MVAHSTSVPSSSVTQVGIVSSLTHSQFSWKIDPGDFKGVISFLARRTIDKHLEGGFLPLAVRMVERVRMGKSQARVLGKKPQKRARRK